jgi:hypothetical protein
MYIIEEQLAFEAPAAIDAVQTLEHQRVGAGTRA